MSYYLMVFEKSEVPSNRAEFMKWYYVLTEWGEEHDYQTPTIASSALQNWYHEMKVTFPPMNGTDAPTDEQIQASIELESHLADYCIGSNVIYVAFSWSMQDNAFNLMKQLAKKHDVGFFDVSANDGDIILPDGTRITD